MSKNLSTFPNQPFIGTLYGVPIPLCLSKPDANGPKAVPIRIDWAQYGASSNKPNVGVVVNFQANNVSPAIPAIRSLYIDNTFSDVAVYVQFQDTLFTITVPPRAVVMSPVFSNLMQFVVYAEGFFTGRVPTTTIFASNVEQPGYMIPTDFTTAVDQTFLFSSIQAVTNKPSPAVYTFLNVPLGLPATDRLIVVGLNASSVVGVLTTNTLTIGGVAATKIAELISSGNGLVTALYYLAVPAGTSATIVATLTGAGATSNSGSIGVYEITGQQSNVPSDFNSAVVTTSTGSFIAVPQTELPGSASIYTSSEFGNSSIVRDWVGASRDGFTNANQLMYEYASYNAIKNEYHSAGLIAHQLIGATWN